MISHAPSWAFVTATTMRTTPVTTAPMLLMSRVGAPPRPAEPTPAHDHAGLRERERDEDANHVERNQRVRVPAEGDEQNRREDAQPMIRSRTPAGRPGSQLARQIAVARENRRQARESPHRRCWPPAPGSASCRPGRVVRHTARRRRLAPAARRPSRARWNERDRSAPAA